MPSSVLKLRRCNICYWRVWLLAALCSSSLAYTSYRNMHTISDASVFNIPSHSMENFHCSRFEFLTLCLSRSIYNGSEIVLDTLQNCFAWGSSSYIWPSTNALYRVTQKNTEKFHFQAESNLRPLCSSYSPNWCFTSTFCSNQFLFHILLLGWDVSRNSGLFWAHFHLPDNRIWVLVESWLR